MSDLDDQREKRPGSRDRINQIKDEMDRDVLRTRIAYAIAQADGDLPGMEPASCDYELADAVIAKLGLRQEWGALDGEDDGTLADTREALKPWPGEAVKFRYITGWESAE